MNSLLETTADLYLISLVNSTVTDSSSAPGLNGYKSALKYSADKSVHLLFHVLLLHSSESQSLYIRLFFFYQCSTQIIILFNNCDQIVDFFLHFGMKQYIFSVDHCQKVSVVKSSQTITSKKWIIFICTVYLVVASFKALLYLHHMKLLS